ncbi:MAG: glyoxalase [Rhodospirillaceae bacterium]|nr:glyoxalase [Rhodospirillaceae bacterium]|tara:strand:- start:497 stop:913 length:417 start_codon:yes stop_codon:yes gene_type:complete
MQDNVFHVALAVDDLIEATSFYSNILDCKERIESRGDKFTVINFFGSQLVLIEEPSETEKIIEEDIDFIEPIKHFGIIMKWNEWHKLVEKLKAKRVPFKISPNIKYHDNVGKVANMFISDPSNNYIEFKSYEDRSKIL